CRRDRCAFPRTGPKATSTVGRLRTGALVRAVVPPPSVQAGTCVGLLAVRASGSGTITMARHDVVVVQGIAVRHCHLLQRSDGYGYGSRSAPVLWPYPRTRTQRRVERPAPAQEAPEI